MILTDKLRKWAVVHTDVSADADDATFEKAIGCALFKADGEKDGLSLAEFGRLSESAEDDEADEFSGLLKDLTEAVKGLTTNGNGNGMKADEEEEEEDDPKKKKCPKCGEKEFAVMKDGKRKCKACGHTEKSATSDGKKDRPTVLSKMLARMSTPEDVEEGEEKSYSIRVKEAAEMYSDTKSAMHFPTHTKSGKSHPMAGKPVMDFSDAGKGRQIYESSDLDKAVAGAFSKFIVQKARVKSSSIAFGQLPQHDKELLCYAMENMKWGGATDGGDFADIKDRKLTPTEQKALIDDSVSGGLEAAPIVFDDEVIQTPLLHGELYPLVNVKPLDRGRRVEGVATGTVTGSWGGVDDSPIALFNTTSYVTAFDTTIFRWEGAVRIGLDFLSDTPIDFGQHFTEQYGERLLEDLDDVIASGNGTTQPEGIVNKTGATSVSFGGATTLGNYESLRFGVGKNEHRANVVNTAVFVGTETSYQRARAIPVGASDARRLGGMDYSSYSWMERPYKINESLTNAQIMYAILARYRMYRRRGLTIRTSTEGDTLLRRNSMLMIATARYGGQQERGATIAKTTTAPA